MPLTFNFHGLSSTLSGSNFQCHIGEIDLVIADAGSSDGTQEIAREYGATLVENPLKTGEAGKSAGIAASSGDLIALVDSDNILDDARWLEKMIRPFDDPEIVAAEPLFYTRRDTDPAL
ncbi:MAG: glycosyltransferase, partial [Verrucomicrobia bacterium]|nr:glycosyltransferase [Verrucomicrobiota bacterium]